MPRYTSYPTAPHFGPLGEAEYRGWLAGIRPEEVWAELRRREGISGIGRDRLPLTPVAVLGLADIRPA